MHGKQNLNDSMSSPFAIRAIFFLKFLLTNFSLKISFGYFNFSYIIFPSISLYLPALFKFSSFNYLSTIFLFQFPFSITHLQCLFQSLQNAGRIVVCSRACYVKILIDIMIKRQAMSMILIKKKIALRSPVLMV